MSAPGVWLPSKEDVYLSISMFGQYRNTRCLTSVFPLIIHEKFRFEKVSIFYLVQYIVIMMKDADDSGKDFKCC